MKNINELGVAILAAGEGKRLKINRPKALLPLMGRKIIDFPIGVSGKFAHENGLKCFHGIVVGHLKEKVQSYLQDKYHTPSIELNFAAQARPLGTADALKAYIDNIPRAKETQYTMVMCADVPLINMEDLQRLFDELSSDQDLNAVAATFEVEDPKGYGRIIRGGKGFHIVEEKHVDEKNKNIKEVNSALYIFKTSFLLQNLERISQNTQTKEFYLTDLFQDSYSVKPVFFGKSHRFLGVNTLKQLEEVASFLRHEKIDELREKGVLFMDAQSFFADWEVEIDQDTVISPNVSLQGKTQIGKNVSIETGSIIKDCLIEDEVIIRPYSFLDQVIVRTQAEIGPFARIRPGVDIGAKSKIGNFVELKKVKLEMGVKISHLSYVGDAEIGENSNIGCGFITCNYDGAKKHKTKIGKNSFIGSDCQVVAPLEIGDNAYVGSGSTITRAIPNDAFAIARSRQVTKEGMAKRFLKNKTSIDPLS